MSTRRERVDSFSLVDWGCMNVSAIILAAGSGTRMKSHKPKVTHELLGRPLVQWVVRAAQDAGFSHIVSVLGHGREQVAPLVESDTTIVVQPEQRGTADAVAVALPEIDSETEAVVVLSGDCPLITSQTIAQLVEARAEVNAGVAVLTMKVDNPFGYGRIVRDSADMVAEIVEQKDCSSEQAAITECNSGFYCFDAALLRDALTKVDSNNAQGEFYLTDVIALAREAGRAVVGVVAEDATECLGVNTRVQLAEASSLMRNRINRAHMLAGVTMWDPTQVWIGPDVEIEPDVELYPQVILMGVTKIEKDCVIGPHTRLVDTFVGEGSHLEETIAEQARIDAHCSCGPRAYLRTGTHLCEGAKAGTHVEIKKSTIGPKSKVPHLSYIGDTTMGSGVNMGAGSITCNYDGAHKWPTEIGDSAFVGSDTMLVAPVRIGAGSIVGAGSVITEEVPADALALGRARQKNIEGWAAEHRQQQSES